MKKRNTLFTLLLLFAFVSFCYLSVSYVKTNVGSDDKQKDLNLNILTTPKSSGYDVTEKWNYTSDYEVNSVAVSADGRYVAVAVGIMAPPGPRIFFFNTSDHDGIPLWSWSYDSNFDSLAISADGRYITAFCSLYGAVYLFNSTVPEPGEDKNYIWSVNWGNIGRDLYSVDISEDGKYIVLGGSDGRFGRIELYNNSYASTGFDKTGEYLWYYDPAFYVYSVAISADGKYVAAGTEYPIFRDADPMDQIFFLNNTDYILGDFQMPMWSFDAGCSIDSIAISAFGEYIVAGSYWGEKAYLFNSTVPEPGEDKYEVWSVDWGEYIYPVDISADGKTIVWGSDDGEQCYVNVYNNSYASSGPDKTDEFLWWYETPSYVNSVAISADGKYIVVGTDYRTNEDTIFLFNNTDIYLEQNHDPEWSFNTTDNDINSVSMSAWGNYIAAGGDYGGNGMSYLFYHARPIPRIFYGNGGGDDDDDEEGAIPFGNYYLLFAAIAVASLIIITKRKAIFSKK